MDKKQVKSLNKFQSAGSKYKNSINSSNPFTKSETNDQANFNHGKLVVCYYRACATRRNPPARFSIEDIVPSLCTHLIYAFAGIDEETNTIVGEEPTGYLGEEGEYARAVALKDRSPNLKVLIAVGGEGASAEKFSNMASDPTTRSEFVQSALAFLSIHNFDGLDLHWLYPAQGGNPEDKANLVALASELKEAFKPKNYILTAAVPGDIIKLEAGYDLANLNTHLDLVNVMSYGYYDVSDNIIGANAPLKHSVAGDAKSVEYTIRYVLTRRISKDKIVLGISFYGSTYLLKNPSGRVEFGHTLVEGGFRGPIIQEDNTMAYNEIRFDFSGESSKWARLWDDQTETPYLRCKNQIISYDNPKSATLKVTCAKRYGLAGIMVWSIDADDFKGLITGENQDYNLLRTINKELGRSEAKDYNVPKATSPIPQASNTASKPPSLVTHGHERSPQSEKSPDATFRPPKLDFGKGGPASHQSPNKDKSGPKLNHKLVKIDSTKNPNNSIVQREIMRKLAKEATYSSIAK